MGVKGLWTLLEPFGQRFEMKALENQVLAVDASIWIYQFRSILPGQFGDQDIGDVREACVVGFLRRICKLLLIGVRPIFVFDGVPSDLKLDTLRRRRHAEDDNLPIIRKNAEHLLRKQLGSINKLEGTNNNQSTPEVDPVVPQTRKRIRHSENLHLDTNLPDISEIFDVDHSFDFF